MEVSCEHKGQIYTYELLGSQPRPGFSNRYLARDISSQFGFLEPDQNTRDVILILVPFGSETLRFQWLQQIQEIAEFSPTGTLRILVCGTVEEGEYAGYALLATEQWDCTLAEFIKGQDLPNSQLLDLFFQLVRTVYFLHQQGRVHGALTPEAIYGVRDPTGSEFIWKCGPGMPTQRRYYEPELDCAGVGEVLFRALKLVSPSRLGSLHGHMRADAFTSRWKQLRFGNLLSRSTGGGSFGSLGNIAENRSLMPTEWVPILDGCLGLKDRWDSSRLLLGGEPPPVVENLTIETDVQTAEITWSAPQFGDVALYDRPENAPAFGQIISATELSSTSPLDCRNNSVRIPVNEPRRLMAVTHLESIAIVGARINHGSLPDPTDLRVEVAEDRLWLSWKWPNNISLCRAVVRTDRFAYTPEGEQQVFECARRVYDGNGGGLACALPPPGSQMFVSVFSCQRTRQGLISSSGSTSGARWTGNGPLVEVGYSVEKASALRRWFSSSTVGPRDYRLKLKADYDVWLPELWLVGAPAGVPTNRESGTLLAAFPAGTRLTAHQTHRIGFCISGTLGWYYRLFFADPKKFSAIRLLNLQLEPHYLKASL